MNDREESIVRLKAAFNQAVAAYWSAAKAGNHVRSEIADAADRVFLARDGLREAPGALNHKEWDEMIADVVDVKKDLEKRGLVMHSRPQTTSTGKKTYRILNPRRFDA